MIVDMSPFENRTLSGNPHIVTYDDTVICNIIFLLANQSSSFCSMITINDIALACYTCVITNPYTLLCIYDSANTNINIVTYFNIIPPKVNTWVKCYILTKFYILCLYIHLPKDLGGGNYLSTYTGYASPVTDDATCCIVYMLKTKIYLSWWIIRFIGLTIKSFSLLFIAMKYITIA